MPGSDGLDDSSQADRHPEPDPPVSDSTPDLFGRIYDELRELAHKRMARERDALTLQTTALVHEVYLRLMKDPTIRWESSRLFFGAAAESMRRILIERARRYAAVKHGGQRRRVDLETMDVAALEFTDSDDAAALVKLDRAIEELRGTDALAAEVVMLRYFGGLSVEEAAATTGRSPRSVKRDWAFARAWLTRQLEKDA
jgi:RNA polymerase sigma factor (TIGR02999 family)